MDNNIRKRLQEAVDALCDGNKSEFCRRIGRSVESIKDVVGGKQSLPGYGLLYDILASDLGISANWLMLGQGEMLVKSQATAPPSSPAVQIGSIQTVNIGNWGELVELLKDKIQHE